MCYVSNRRVYALSRIYSSHIPNMVIIHDTRRPCGPLTSVPVACYINIMILIIGAHNVTPDLWSVLHNARLMYTTYVQHAHNQHESCRIFDMVQYESKDQLLFDENMNHTERTRTQTTLTSRGHSSTFDYILFLPIEYTFILSNGVKSH